VRTVTQAVIAVQVEAADGMAVGRQVELMMVQVVLDIFIHHGQVISSQE
jgi:hypothetical protein